MYRLEVKGQPDLTVTDATGVDPGLLADIRVAAMRPSLEAIGRFDPDRARSRFLAGFEPSQTWVLWIASAPVGFFVVRDRDDHLYLDHIYVDPGSQGLGLGRQVVEAVQDRARDAGVSVRLMALRDSPANAFYASCGFHTVGQDGVDIHYEWRASDV